MFYYYFFFLWIEYFLYIQCHSFVKLASIDLVKGYSFIKFSSLIYLDDIRLVLLRYSSPFSFLHGNFSIRSSHQFSKSSFFCIPEKVLFSILFHNSLMTG